MNDLEKVWREKSDEELFRASEKLSDFTDEGRQIVINELRRRELKVPTAQEQKKKEVAEFAKKIAGRYSDAYRVAHSVTGIGSLVKGVGLLLGFVLIVIGLSGDSAFGLLFIMQGIIIGFLFFIIGIVASAVGQMLKATVDTAINTSPVIRNSDKTRIMDLD